MNSAPEILKDAAGCLAQRGTEYDTGSGQERSAPKAAEIYTAITGKRITAEEVWLVMLSVKLARSQRGKPKLDTFVDLAAYSALWGETALERLSQPIAPSS